ncbi:MAG: hypothetical protein A3B86_02375 [Candidatus Yanofskybacteria bacterium RIFCSPHIGHO2_02_FULL_38_22b]|uniref:D-isomer specific 2-hydroxyacid dehydrogenase NAD-binding domain-containing protein n=1 Tax=Candidatus Yanofskybacteria bacterium RIFCSPHIGHO2_02_FULL_38_22b TaxID=1802673 RepID=A0A1F8F4Y4_9BACT|nr:MAG: hypothetical protein A3B86_02375 [Candidatus Yanofskybacteria bacterium RIFCSPHIGHO2_02_FULL_38_22b]OGN20292.1 MAG: hypothetical protein A2910_03210 [Candidatus Yanofskybacteria bacterium RIFCSPLOWO2_01_FULL_39_28]
MKFYFIVPKDKAILPSKILLDKLGSFGTIEIIRHQGKLQDIEQLKKDKDDKILAVDPDVFDWDFDAETVKDLSGVKAVMSSSTSFDWIKPQILKEIGVLACNVPGFSSDAVAEYAVAMAIDVSRRLPIIIKNNWKIDWDYSKPMLLKGKRAGVIGLGRIGKKMAEVCQGIGMEVVYWSRKSRDDRFRKVELDELFETADVIMPALVENSETKQIITKKLLDSVKSTAILIGIGRVKVLWDEDYILNKVNKEEIAGYAFEGDNTKEIGAYEGNVWALPAMAWHTQESLDNLMEIWVENMIALANGNPQNVIN